MKNHLFYERCNANAMKIKLAKRKVILSFCALFAIAAITFISTGINAKASLCSFSPLLAAVMLVGKIDGKETSTHKADGTEKTAEETLLYKFKFESEQAIATALKNFDGSESQKQAIKQLSETLEKLKSEEFATIRKNMDELGMKFKALQEKPTVDEKSVKTQIKSWMETNKAAITAIKGGEKASLTALIIKVASPMTPSNTYNGSAYLPQPEFQSGITDIVRVQPTFWDYIKKGATNAAAYVWVNKKNPLGAAGFIGPGVAKPGISFEIGTEISNAKKIAVSEKCAIELFQDIAGLQSWFEQEIIYQLKAKLNTTLMTGTNSSTVPAGIQTISTTYSLTTVKTTNPNHWDAIRACVAQLRSGNLVGNVTAFMNPIDYANMVLTKAQSQGQLFIPMETGATIVEDNNVPVGYVQVALLDYYKVLIYQDFQLMFGWENDDFTKNLTTAIGEMRIHQFFSENHTGAFIYDTFSNIETAIAIPA